MDKLIQYLKAQGVMKPGDLLLTNSDGCAAQYRYSTTFYLLSNLAISNEIAIDRVISCPGHGKDIVHGVNGTTKTEWTRASANHLKTAAEADDESGVDTKKLLLQWQMVIKVYQMLLNVIGFLSLKEQLERSPIGKRTRERTPGLFREFTIGLEGEVKH